MPRRSGPREIQLDLEWTAAMQWTDVPAGVREELRDALRALLLDRAGAAVRGPEAPRDE